MVDPVMSRRERRRQETYDEIVQVSRELLREGCELSVRAVATQMGMTSPALYRYLDSVDELHVLVARDICADVVAAMTRARDHYPCDDPAARLAASATMFRCWALANRVEFQMAFANPTLADVWRNRSKAKDRDAQNPFAAYFAQLFIELHSRGLIAVPRKDDVDPGLQTLVDQSSDPFTAKLGLEGMGTMWLFKLAWVRLYGVLMVEVFGRVEEELVDSDLVFNTLMRETFASLGLASSWDRLIQVSRDTAARA
ncbi:TetR/AcrR family transcriptional regulator [Lentzea aerocolonigenes]|uniref:TetR/AcrR family transcriptional regulator n=1 Tax=Lentzea aerocolonigenes TaxID=68170 RepID=UPI000AB33DA4|nr:WHG domain-containing protein [Lentzea aerocolonigenes]